MTELYKYLPANAARSVYNAGRIRIGTLYGYRNVELFGTGVGDRDEGKRIDWSRDPNIKTGDQLNAVERQTMRIPSSMVVCNNSLEVHVNSPDYYILSFSRVLNPEIAAGLSRQCSEKYDSCIQIVDVNGLLREISKKMVEFARFYGIHTCVYRPRRRCHGEEEIPPALLKDPTYKYQSEVRAIWSSIAGIPTPRFVDIENARKFYGGTWRIRGQVFNLAVVE